MWMKILANVCRLLLGAVLVFSGFSKGVDPLGSTYKFLDYFHAFHMDALTPYALPLAILMNGAELLIGVALIANVWMRFTSWMALLFMTFFTVLTFILALFNPVSDCGCFGDAITLSNWQTFYKNILIIGITIIVFIYRGNFITSLTGWGNTMVVLFTSLAFVYFSYYCYEHLPVIDFRPFRVGNYLPSQMVVPEGSPTDSFSTVLVYQNKKTGENRETADLMKDSVLWQDTATWRWLETKNKLVREGVKPPIHDFTIESLTEGDITQSVLSDTGFVFLAVIKKYHESDSAGLLKLEQIHQWCKNRGVRFYALSASAPEDVNSYKARLGLTFESCITDETPLKTMVRSNPGLLLIKQGTVLGMWAHADFPELSDKTYNLYEVIGNRYRRKSEMQATIVSFLLLSLVLSFVFIKNTKK